MLDWIPGIPPVEIDVPAQDKHRVPDNLRVRFVPFGSGRWNVTCTELLSGCGISGFMHILLLRPKISNCLRK